MSVVDGPDFKVVHRTFGRAIHVPESAATYGKREAPGVRRLYVEVKDESGHVVYQTWQDGPIEHWERVTLFFDRYALDAEGNRIGLSYWGEKESK